MGENWYLSQEEEDAHRQVCLEKAGMGDEKANLELQRIYGVHLRSQKERATLVYDTPKRGKQKARKS